ncbi:glycosyltransferase, partial [Pseudoalteromonas sp. TB43-MNA-CIBAN-0091]
VISEQVNIKHLNGNTINILFVGRIVADKGVFDLIEAISRQNKRVMAIFVGDGPDLVDAKKVVNDKQLHELISFTGQLPHSELNQL